MKLAARLTLAGLVLVFAFTTLYVAAFHAPRPRSVDVAVVGGAPQVASLQGALDAHGRGAFDVRPYGSEEAAREALLDTNVRGVVVPGPGRERVLVAGAGGVAPADAVAAAVRGVAAGAQVQDVRPLPASDRRGLSPLFAVVGTMIPSLVFGVLLSVFGRALPARVRWPAVVAFAVVAGLVAAFDIDVLVGALNGHFVRLAAVVALLALAASAAAHGLGHLGGPAGIVTAVLLLLLLGVSSAGGAVTYQFEPGFFGAVSQLLPPGAALTAVRNVQYFDGAATLAPLLTLAAWAVGGLALGMLGERFGPHVRGA
jgi:hypothetical protein